MCCFLSCFFLLSINYGCISCVYFTKFKELPTLEITYYVIAIESRVRKYLYYFNKLSNLLICDNVCVFLKPISSAIAVLMPNPSS